MPIPRTRRALASTLFVSSVYVLTAQTPAPARPPGARTLVFADEFDRAGAPDPARWRYELGYIRNKEQQFYTARPENARVEDGVLVIEARREDYEGFRYTSASLNTRGTFALRYGRVEVRAKIPSGIGTWPAIWMLGTNRSEVGWPACGEIDIMEHVGFDPGVIHGTVHTAAYNHVLRTQRSGTVTVPRPDDAFHVYALDWSRDRIDISLDGRRYFTFANEGTGDRTWPFDGPQYLLINLAVGGSWGGQKGIDDTAFPHRYLIDYVRIYQ